PESVHPSGGDPREIERGRAEAPDAGGVRRNGSVDLRPLLGIPAAEERNARANQAVGKVASPRHAQPRLVEPGSAALLRPEPLIGQRLVDEALSNLGAAAGLALLDRDR